VKKITKVVTEKPLKFGSEQARSQFYEEATPGVEFAVEAPWLWITWRNQCRGVPLVRVVEVEGVEMAQAPARRLVSNPGAA
jgi:hypothetical protein